MALTATERISVLLVSGLPLRPTIWQAVFEWATLAPFFGHGLLTPHPTVVMESIGFETDNAHCGFLATLRDGGLVGLALLLLVLFAGARAAYRFGRWESNYLLLVMLLYGITSMATSADELITRPRELWAVLWLPLGLAAGTSVPRAGGEGREL